MVDGITPGLRLSDAERDELVAQLTLALTEGRLDVSEFEERSRTVYAAKVASDLAGVLDGLPVDTTPAVRSKPTLPAPRSGTRWFFSLLGDRAQRGNVELGEKAVSVSMLGDTTFDLTQVQVSEVDLRIFSLLGDVTVIVPPDAGVAANVFLVMGDRDDDTRTPGSAQRLAVRVNVVALMGNVKVVTA